MKAISDNLPLTVEEAARILKVSRFTLYEMIKRGEIPAQRIGRGLRINPEVLQRFVLGKSARVEQKNSTECQAGLVRFAGSHDPVMELLAEFLKHAEVSVPLSLMFVGSMEGLIDLYKGEADLAGIHLWDDKTEEYNLPFIEHVLPGEKVLLVNLVQRMQGWIVPPGNPLGFQGWEDISRKDIKFINRQRGSGTRIRTDAYLRQVGISPKLIKGYEQEESNHFGVACRVANGEANAGIGVQAAAQRMGLDFIPLFKERYDLVCLATFSQTPTWESIVKTLQSQAFKNAVLSQPGYDNSLTGTFIVKN